MPQGAVLGTGRVILGAEVCGRNPQEGGCALSEMTWAYTARALTFTICTRDVATVFFCADALRGADHGAIRTLGIGTSVVDGVVSEPVAIGSARWRLLHGRTGTVTS